VWIGSPSALTRVVVHMRCRRASPGRQHGTPAHAFHAQLGPKNASDVMLPAEIDANAPSLKR
jgi:hypothetical protein